MRIVVDLQGAQTGSRFRGIGKYSISLAQSIVKNAVDHEVWILLNAALPSTIEPIRALFDKNLPQNRIKVFEAPIQVRAMESTNLWRSRTSELIREAVLSKINPDVLLVTSLFEGWDSDASVSIKLFDKKVLTATILYDLIPFLYRDNYLESKEQSQWYFRRIEFLQQSDLLLSISESSRQTAIKHLGILPDKIVNISGGVDQKMFSGLPNDNASSAMLRKHGISKRFILYVPGGFDWRKNFHALFDAFSFLPEKTRSAYQLVIPGNVPQGIRQSLDQYAKNLGINHQVVFPGYLPDDELSVFYASCRLFVYPSLHEGLGFPVLEAMACGAPVIGSNATSVPEVIDFPEALFDPSAPREMADKMLKGISDDSFRLSLIRHGAAQVSKFSWDNCARLTINALERLHSGKMETESQRVKVSDFGFFSKGQKKILVLKLDHMGDFTLAIPAMVKLKKRFPNSVLDIVLGSWNADFARNLGIFDRIFTFDFFSPQSFFGPKLFSQSAEDLLGKLEYYDIAIDLRRQRDTRFLLTRINAKCKVGYQSHWEDIDKDLNICLPADIDRPEVKLPQNLRSISLQMLDLVNVLPDDINDFLVFPKLTESSREGLQIAMFPKAGNMVRDWAIENYVSIVASLLKDARVDQINIYLTKKDSGVSEAFPQHEKVRFHTGLSFETLCDSLAKNSLALANNSGGAHLSSYLGLKVIEVFSGHELPAEWGPVYGENTIISVDVPCSPCHIGRLDECQNELICLTRITPEIVANALFRAIDDMERGSGKNVATSCSDVKFDEVDSVISGDRRSPETFRDNLSGTLPASPIERAGASGVGSGFLPDMDMGNHRRERLIRSISEVNGFYSEGDLLSVARSISLNFPSRRHRELIVDVSDLFRRDSKTGIHRVVRSILSQWLRNPPPGFQVLPVYFSNQEGCRAFRRAEKIKATLLGQQFLAAQDDFVDPVEGDVFVGLDLNHHGTIEAGESGLFDSWKNRGVRLNFVVYDLLHLMHPEWFLPNTWETIVKWMSTVVRVSDSLACISKSVFDDVHEWRHANPVPRYRQLIVNHFRLSGNLGDSIPTMGISGEESEAIQCLKLRPTFLAVGTIEPRKGYAQLLSAFERLWSQGENLNLAIVGKKGWMMDDLVRKMINHPELKKRLFWFSNCTDECLEKIYRSSTCLIAPSEGEGFGLPLAEASLHGIPVISRDLPVFREILESHAFYFSGSNPESLSKAVLEWILLYKSGKAPGTENLPKWTWSQSAEQLLNCIEK